MQDQLQIVGVIQARMSSRRFPGKVLQPLNGMPLLNFLIKRIQQATSIDQLIVATSINPADDEIVACVNETGIEVIRGPEDDVLTRYLQVLEKFPTQAVIRITADNPLSDPYLLDLNVRNFLKKHLDYAYMKNVPIGTACDLFCAPVLREIDKHTTNPYHREHINAYILDHPDSFCWEFFGQIPEQYRRPDLSVTVDTPEDFKWVQSILSHVGHEQNVSLKDIIAIADRLHKKMDRNIVL